VKIHYSLDQTGPIPHPVVTTGSFDGVHIGHRVIIERLNSLAREIGGESVLITFHPHPRRVLYPETTGKNLLLISSQREKIALLEKTGLDHLVILTFTKDFARITCNQFIEDYLVTGLGAEVVVVGFNHYFGYNREGNFEFLYQLSRKHGFRVEEIPHQDIQNETVSSTKIRKALMEGNIQRANAYLDHYYIVRGVLKRDPDDSYRNGRDSYRMEIEEDVKLIPADGIYAVSLHLQNTIRKACFRVSGFSIEENHLGGGMNLGVIPLDTDLKPDGEEAVAYFHKRIRELGSEEPLEKRLRLLQTDLKEIEELIY